jgi:tRNA (guanosine-2'-O-)-methyltransferase
MKRNTEETQNLQQSSELWPENWSAQGVIACLEPFALDDRRRRIEEVLTGRIGSITVLMDAPHDPHNGAAILRSCDAFGIPEVHVVQRVEEFQVARRVTKGTDRWLEVHAHATAEQALSALRERNFELVATHPKGELVPSDLREIPRLALVLGNEHDGICEAIEQAATRRVRIPMRGFVESLNVSVAAAILLSHATEGRPGDLSDVQRFRLYARGLLRSVPRALEILAASAPS